MRFLHRVIIPALFLAMLAAVLVCLATAPASTQAALRHGAAGSTAQRTNGTSSLSCGSGNFWNLAPSPNPASSANVTLNATAAISPYDAWAVGYSAPVGKLYQYNTAALHWNGTQWSVVPTPNAAGANENVLYGVTAIASNNVWAVGYSITSSNPTQALIEHWDGTSWTIIPGATPANLDANYELVSITAISSTDIWAVGWWSASPEFTLAEHWNGTQWSIVSTPDQGTGSNSRLSGVVAIASNNVWAVGGVEDATATSYSTLIEQWNGSAWSTVPSPNVGTAGNELYGVTALNANDIWAVGGTFNASGNILQQTLTEHWNGSVWSVVSAAAPPAPISNFLSVAALSSTNVWAVGYSVTANNVESTLIEHWNGTSWSVAPSPNPGSASDSLYSVAAVPTGRYLVAVGTFSNNSSTNFQTLVVQHIQTIMRGAAGGARAAILCP